MKKVVVVLNGPHVKKWVWAQFAWVEVFWNGRINVAIAKAMQLKVPLLVCGDANGGKDLAHMVGLAQSKGINTIPCENGKNKEDKNTRGDCLAAIRELQRRPDVTRVHLVTCWYHMPRAIANMRHELALVLPDRKIVIESCPVWTRLFYGFRQLFRHWDRKKKAWVGGEVYGLWALWKGDTVGTRSAVGKPDHRDIA